MKKITPKWTPKHKSHLKLKLLTLSIFLVLVAATIFTLVQKVNSWFDNHTLKFNQVVDLKLSAPITIVKREVNITQVINVINDVPEPSGLGTDIEKYIYEKFGIENYKVAVAVARAESGLREDAININTNGTVDIGIFQINSVHYKKPECQLKDIVNAKKNVDCAYSIYKASGWSAWSAYKNGAFIGTLK